MFKHSLNVEIGSGNNLEAFLKGLQEIGYELPEYDPEYYSMIAIDNDGNIDYWRDVCTREFRFDLDKELTLALAIAAIRDNDIPHVGEYVATEGSIDDISVIKHLGQFVRIREVEEVAASGNFNVDGYETSVTGIRWTTSLDYNRKATAEELIEFFNPKKKIVMSNFSVGGSKYLKKALLEELSAEIGLVQAGNDPVPDDGDFIVNFGKGYGRTTSRQSTHFTLPADWQYAKEAFIAFLKANSTIEIQLNESYKATVYKDYLIINGSPTNRINYSELAPLFNPTSLLKGQRIFDYSVVFPYVPAIQIGCTEFSSKALTAIRDAFGKLNM